MSLARLRAEEAAALVATRRRRMEAVQYALASLYSGAGEVEAEALIHELDKLGYEVKRR